jgi:hypothetical protein
MQVRANIHVGKPDIRPDAAAHSPGVREGNHPWIFSRLPGVKRVGKFMAIATVRRSTGINPNGRAPIDPRMPNLTPP